MTSKSYFIGFLVENFAIVFHSMGNILLQKFRYNSCEIKLKQTSENFERKLKIPVRMEETFGGILAQGCARFAEILLSARYCEVCAR